MLDKEKGVVCKIVDESQMPVDEMGNVADLVADPNATVSRMNLGRLYEHYIAGACRDFRARLLTKLHLGNDDNEDLMRSKLEGQSTEVIKWAWAQLCGFYDCINEDMAASLSSVISKEDIITELAWVLSHGIFVYIPTNAKKENWQIVRDLEQNELYKPHYGKVSYVGTSGKRVVTLDDIRIGSMYVVMLEKIADDWSSVASCKLQHFGVPSQLTKHDKYSKPTRMQAVRGSGEAEMRILGSYIGGRFVAEMMDRNNNPKTHKVIVDKLLTADKPSNIDNVVDRDTHRFSNHKPLSLVKHILSCIGLKFDYLPYKPEY